MDGLPRAHSGMQGFSLPLTLHVSADALAMSDTEFIHWMGAQLSDACQDLMERALVERMTQFDTIAAQAAQMEIGDLLNGS